MTISPVRDLLSLTEILGAVREEMGAVQAELRRQLGPPEQLVSLLMSQIQQPGGGPRRGPLVDGLQALPLLMRVREHLIAGQGKGLRPALVMLAARVGSRVDVQTLVALAASIELMHHATLVHDDIIDAAPVRRKQPSLNAVWGNEISVISGDYLYARAFVLAASSLQPPELKALAHVAEVMCQGELAEIEHRYDTDLTEEGYLDIIRQKTAILMSACCELGAAVAGAPPETARRMGEFGTAFGLAFQIADDCLDLVGSEESLGKAVGNDLMQGSLSLPFIYLGQSQSAAQRRALFEPYFSHGDRHGERPPVSRLVTLARECGAITRAYETARVWARKAQEALEPLNGSPVRAHFWSLAEYAVERQS